MILQVDAGLDRLQKTIAEGYKYKVQEAQAFPVSF